jgi:hypothetical protein
MTLDELPTRGTIITFLGSAQPLESKEEGGKLRIKLPLSLDGKYAFVFKLAGYTKNGAIHD